MKNHYSILLLLFGYFCFNSCQLTGVEDRFHDYPNYKPVYMDASTFRSDAAIQFKEPQPLLEPGKIYYKNRKIFINEKYKGIHVLDNSDPENTSKVGFIEIPGNIDIAIKGSVLYVDSSVDFVAIDISNLQEPKVIKRIENMFPAPLPPDGNMNAHNDKKGKIIIDWEDL